MSGVIEILPINPGSDGDGRKWPKHHYQRNDAYFQERIATDKWIKDLPGGPREGVTYRLNRLPQGYAGFERARPDSKHVDRYIYGHPNGQFRSLNEFYPHFKHLMDFGNPVDCQCKLCSNGDGKKTGAGSKSASGSRPTRERKTVLSEPGAAAFERQIPDRRRKDRSDSDVQRPQKRRLVDIEGVPDVYETMIGQLKAAGPGTYIDEPIEERMSPDWRTGNSMSKSLLREWKSLPRYVPRVGEIVLFVRKLSDGEAITWKEDEKAFQRFAKENGEWLERPQWEVGVVTQMPQEATLDEDLIGDSTKKQAVNESGFRIEPLSEPGNQRKPYGTQYKYVPLHYLRPFALWSECLTGLAQAKWHPSIEHALTIVSSFCVIGKYRFRGSWPHATVFCRGVYIGAELIMVGDTVRLIPEQRAQEEDIVTDVMVVTAIRLRFVNLDLEETGIITPPPDSPYQTCLHISGRAFTLHPTRSFDGVGKVPIDPNAGILPAGLDGYGQWYHYHDPNDPTQKLELPYTRILGRCVEDTAANAWFNHPSTPREPSLRAGGDLTSQRADITAGLEGIVQARKFSMMRDTRIKRNEGKSWFWADTRIEQLGLHEVNNRSVGGKDESRTKGQMAKWKASLKAMDGKVGAVGVSQASKKQVVEGEVARAQSSYGMIAGSAEVGTGTESQSQSDEDAEGADGEKEEGEDEGEELEGINHDEGDERDDKELNGSNRVQQQPAGMLSAPKPRPGTSDPIELSSDSEDSDDIETKQLAEKLAKNIRANEARLGR